MSLLTIINNKSENFNIHKNNEPQSTSVKSIKNNSLHKKKEKNTPPTQQQTFNETVFVQ
jgi:hypothetical protein